MTKKILLLIGLTYLASCSSSRIAQIRTGGFEYKTLESDYISEAPTNGETYLTYRDSNEVVQSNSNIIQFNVQSRTVKKPSSIPKPVQYPYATISKKCYLSNFRTLIKPIRSIAHIGYLIFAIISVPPTFGGAIALVNQMLNVSSFIDFTTYDLTNQLNFKNNRNSDVDQKVDAVIQLSVDLYCAKRQPLNDTLRILDNLPEGAKLNSYKIIGGNRFLKDVKHISYMKDNREYHEYKLIGENASFAEKHANVTIKQNITYTFLDRYFGKDCILGSIPRRAPAATAPATETAPAREAGPMTE
jgi:hypothetical protein